MTHSLSPCTDGSPSLCGVSVPQPVANSCNEPCVVQCPDSTVVIYPPPVVVTIPGPILSTFPQQSTVGSVGAPEVGSGFSGAPAPGGLHVSGGARWARGYPVGSCKPCWTWRGAAGRGTSRRCWAECRPVAKAPAFGRTKESLRLSVKLICRCSNLLKNKNPFMSSSYYPLLSFAFPMLSHLPKCFVLSAVDWACNPVGRL